MKVLISAYPFCEKDQTPIILLKEEGIDYCLNPFFKKPDEHELSEIIANYDIVIAGTETFTESVIKKATNLKMISRTGVGYDNIDMKAASLKGVNISVTSNTLSEPVAEFNVGLMIILLRKAQILNSEMHNEIWNRKLGKSLADCIVGIVGVGRIGSRIIQLLKGFNCKRILLNDFEKKDVPNASSNIEWCDKKTIYESSDIISINLPLTDTTRNMITRKQLKSMKQDAILINTSRGGIINEIDLNDIMVGGHLAGAAIDVFEKEPYDGQLKNIDRCFLTPHIASMTFVSRIRTEIEATEEVIRFFKGEPLMYLVPQDA